MIGLFISVFITFILVQFVFPFPFEQHRNPFGLKHNGYKAKGWLGIDLNKEQK